MTPGDDFHGNVMPNRHWVGPGHPVRYSALITLWVVDDLA